MAEKEVGSLRMLSLLIGFGYFIPYKLMPCRKILLINLMLLERNKSIEIFVEL